ncbi:MAG: aspartate aminotransferase family protein [Acidimicrobiia bacterium]
MTGAIHGPDVELGALPERVAAFIADRVGHAPLGRTATRHELDALLAGTISAAGLGSDEAWRRFVEVVVPATVGLDSERFLAFIPASPTAAAVWMDAAVGAASFAAESSLEAAGVVAAENQALRFLAELAGLPDGAGGCFMTGGSIGNLSALAVARDHARPGARRVAVADTTHASVDNALHLLGLDALVVPTAPDGRFTAEALRAAAGDATDIATIVASAGSTNAGVIDDLAGLADVAGEWASWLHVDGAYGGAALLVPQVQSRFAGIERADSLIIDPHKWLFATSGSCALLYRTPSLAAAVHTQHGPYLDILRGDDAWNPSDYGFQLTRRASGLPLWFSLAVHGVDAHATAVHRGIELARYAADELTGAQDVELVMQPELSVVLFRRAGWTYDDWSHWARRLLESGVAFVAPTTWKGEPVGRLVFMHPRTTETIVDEVVASLS